MKVAPSTSGKNFEKPKRLDRLQDRQEPISNNSNNNSSNNISPPPSPPSLLPLASPSSDPFIPPPPPFILPPSGRFLEPFEQSSNLGNFHIRLKHLVLIDLAVSVVHRLSYLALRQLY